MSKKTDYMGNHIFPQFDETVEETRNRLLLMGGMVEKQLVASLQCFRQLDEDLAENVVMNDAEINSAEVRLDEECVLILARHQPTAKDLRLILSFIKTVTDLERIGDEARKIAQMSVSLSSMASSQMSISRMDQFENINFFGGQVVTMLKKTLDAFARVDHVAALEIAKSDKSNDRLYDNIMRNLITYMMEDPRTISSILSIIWVVRALERVGDHAKNICQYIHYLAEGDDIRHQDLSKIKLENAQEEKKSNATEEVKQTDSD